MFRKNRTGDHGDDSGGHNRPWVYFMIDSFFLVTQFFVLTFKLKTGNDLILPNTFPPEGGIIEADDAITTPVNIDVVRNSNESMPWYKINGGQALDEDQMNTMMSAMSEGHDPSRYAVHIYYEGNVFFRDVMRLFNTCSKLNISKCSLRTTREPGSRNRL